MNTPWIIGLAGAILWFTYFEYLAFKHPERQNTLSRCIYNIGSKWPLSIFIMGMFAGGLAVHLFWHWCPDNVSIGMRPDNVSIEMPVSIGMRGIISIN